MFETIIKIRQIFNNAVSNYRKMKNEMERQRVLNQMQEAGIVILQ